MSAGSHLVLRGVRENNLKNLDLSLEHDKLIVITGVSGSGKSTIAFDTVYAEGGQRYIETFSPYTRQFLDRLHQPDLDSVEGVRPALALEQRNRTTSSRSTVGTSTEINDYLKILWAQIAEPICPTCQKKISRATPLDVCDAAFAKLQAGVDSVIVGFELVVRADISVEAYREVVQSQGFIRFINPKTGRILRLSELAEEDFFVSNGSKERRLLIALERISSSSDSDKTAFRRKYFPTVQQAYHLGRGALELIEYRGEKFSREIFRELPSCNSCGFQPPSPRPAMFTFNSPLGACKTCSGFGRVLDTDLNLCIPDHTKSIEKGAVQCWTSKAFSREQRELKKFCSENGIDMTVPWNKLPQKQRDLIFYGAEGKGNFQGLSGWFEWLKTKRHKMHVRIFLARHRSESICPDCKGGRLQSEASVYKLQGKTLQEIWGIPLSELMVWFDSIREDSSLDETIEIPLEEIRTRLRYLNHIGLGYLTLDRQAKTLSGGEFQRVNLTSILGTRLTNTTLVLDEPTIGLHPRDTAKLVDALKMLRDRGNSLVVVEHEPEVMLAADELLDIGPRSGSKGGEIIFQGPPDKIAANKDSVTAKYLRGEMRFERKRFDTLPAASKRSKKTLSRHLFLKGATLHNLDNLDVRIPLNKFVVITGVSGSGKSTLVHRCLYESAKVLLGQGVVDSEDGATTRKLSVQSLSGLDAIDDIILVDQSPIGKTPRSNPATYTGVWDVIREVLAEAPRAIELGVSKSAFSFNVDGGRCPSCKGAGYERIEMQFLADVFVECEKCGGSRFKDSILTVSVGGKNVQELLDMSLEECVPFFREVVEARRVEKIESLLTPLIDLGLGYLRLGQPLSEVSGGEAQRIKLASGLTLKDDKKLLYVLDEPTTGLHPFNIQFLLSSFEKLLEKGHSIVCVEHNRDLIQAADWLIDMGPEGGALGGKVIAEGEPSALIAERSLVKSHTLSALQAADDVPLNALKRAKSLDGVAVRKKSFSKEQVIEIRGAKHHNLKNISVQIPMNKLTVFTGVSGSGKSTLAFDIVFQEGQRRYIDCLSPYARQYMTHLKRAEVDRVDHIPPTIAVSQKTAPPLGVSTIATTTEIYQFLRLLYSKVGVQHCPKHNLPIQGLSAERIAQEILEYSKGKRTYLFAPAVSGRKGFYNDLFQRALRAEITEARVDGQMLTMHEDLRLERHKLHWISLLTASFSQQQKNPEMLKAAVQQALLLGSGTVEVALDTKDAEPRIFSSDRVCPKCKRGFRELDPQDFSFRSNRGLCTKCGGRGLVGDESDQKPCPSCEGARIGEVGRSVYVEGRKIFELSQMTAPELLAFVKQLKFPERLNPVVEPILRELKHRLGVIDAVGLGYLRLDRDASTISGGEAQRLRLAKTLGSPLTGICYVLDEPTIGLHPKDHERLMDILFQLRDQGNTVIVVEHDEETICLADHVIDMGPAGGAGGGRVVAEGSPVELLSVEESKTGQALKMRLNEELLISKKLKTPEFETLKLSGAVANNLKNVDAEFVYGGLTVVCGVSGAGKSSLVHHSLVPAILEEFGDPQKGRKTFEKLSNHQNLERYLEIDQSPVGKTPASCPASYLGVFDQIRKVFALVPDAQARGYNQSFFSYNSGKGRCSNCEGKGFLKVPMSFLPDAVSECEVCRGLRYNDGALEITFQGLSIGEVLQKTMSEAREIFANHSLIKRTLDYVTDLGIGYLTLGQPTHTLSGGEIQRLKLARELGAREAVNTLYILDEPTVGLHMTDVEKLMNVLRKLIDKGNSIVVIEHNLDVITAADHLIELGPGPGEAGGRVIFSGHPYELRKRKVNTPTKDALLSRRSVAVVQDLVKRSSAYSSTQNSVSHEA